MSSSVQRRAGGRGQQQHGPRHGDVQVRQHRARRLVGRRYRFAGAAGSPASILRLALGPSPAVEPTSGPRPTNSTSPIGICRAMGASSPDSPRWRTQTFGPKRASCFAMTRPRVRPSPMSSSRPAVASVFSGAGRPLRPRRHHHRRHFVAPIWAKLTRFGTLQWLLLRRRDPLDADRRQPTVTMAAAAAAGWP